MSSPDVDLAGTLTGAEYQAVLFRSLADILDSHPDLHPPTITWAEHPDIGDGWRRVSIQLPDAPALAAWRGAMAATGPDTILAEGLEPMSEGPGMAGWEQAWFTVDGQLIAASDGTIQFWAPSR